MRRVSWMNIAFSSFDLPSMPGGLAAVKAAHHLEFG